MEQESQAQEEKLAIGTSGSLRLSRRFTAVEYPGYVQNVDKALETLGGESKVAQAIPHPDMNTKRFLELRYRPQDPFCHPIYGDHHSTSNLLAKVTRKKAKNKEETYHVEITGIIDNTFKFKGMADFQYLSSRKKQKTVGSEINGEQAMDVIESGRQLQQNIKNEEEEGVPMELPPPIFSKIDIPQDYGFQRNKTFHLEEVREPDSNTSHYRLVNPPKKMFNPICYATYQTEGQGLISCGFIMCADVPREPAIDLKTVLEENEKDDLCLIASMTQQLFDQRPVWTLPALKANLPFQVYSSTNPLKKILPCIAYYVKNGPWRMMWIKFGFDPKQKPESKIYQGIDLRLNASLFKEHQRMLVNRNPRRLKKGEAIKLQTLQGPTKEEDPTKTLQDGHERKKLVYKLLAPPIHRQTVYQFCDIENKEIQELVSSSSKPTCDFKSGWLKPEDLKKLRDLLKEIATKLLQQEKGIVDEEKEEDEEEKEMEEQELMEYEFEQEHDEENDNDEDDS